MMPDPSKNRKLFDKIAERYAQKDIYPVSKEARKFQIDTLIGMLKDTYHKSYFDQTLEFGCGHGAKSQYFKSFVAHYTGLDFSQNLIDIANKTYGSEVFKFQCCDIESYTGSINFDLLLGFGVLHHVNDVDQVLKRLYEISRNSTIIAVIEPQKGNPVVQLMRSIRKKIDSSYSDDQQYFTRKELEKHFESNGFRVGKVLYQGYFSVPFSQVILKPKWLFIPMVKVAILLDRCLQSCINSVLAWNIILIAQKRKDRQPLASNES